MSGPRPVFPSNGKISIDIKMRTKAKSSWNPCYVKNFGLCYCFLNQKLVVMGCLSGELGAA